MDLGRGSRPINLNGLGGCSEGVTGVGFGPEGIDALGGGLFLGKSLLSLYLGHKVSLRLAKRGVQAETTTLLSG